MTATRTVERALASNDLPRQAERFDERSAWAAVMRRDETWDGRFVYAVRTTGVFCRPSCPSRRAKRENVAFFQTPADARAGGFRPCRRCRPAAAFATRASEGVARARALLEREIRQRPDSRLTLETLARTVGVSPFHLQRQFKRVTGATPAQFARALRSDRLKAELRRGSTVSQATYGAGYASSSRVYEAADTHLGMTPATYRHGGRGAHIRYVVTRTSYGQLLVGVTERGVCAVQVADDVGTLERALAAEFPNATRERLRAATDDVGQWVEAIVDYLEGRDRQLQVPLDVGGTEFQRRVWQALRQIPYGETRSYTEVAASIGAPRAARAVGSACARNRVALVVPCHRVVRESGALGGYRWGLARKQRLLDQERRGQ
jgi:AraC family transcriptional regulator, regulatory protein of adaptative response / methylated-DNA-[protein]-cysteine methyltransferase